MTYSLLDKVRVAKIYLIESGPGTSIRSLAKRAGVSQRVARKVLVELNVLPANPRVRRRNEIKIDNGVATSTGTMMMTTATTELAAAVRRTAIHDATVFVDNKNNVDNEEENDGDDCNGFDYNGVNDEITAPTNNNNSRAKMSMMTRATGTENLDYALRLTATTVPDYLTCGICHKLAKMAMLVPWDAEGRPTCESCIHNGLVKGGYTCPLTGMEGVSPDDLFPNVALRKAIEAFELDIMAKMELIEKQIAEEAKEEEEKRKRKIAQEEEEEEEDAERKRMHRDSNDFDEDDRSGRLKSKRRQKGTAAKKRKSSTNVAGSIEALEVSFQL
jgi:hypothetical protein